MKKTRAATVDVLEVMSESEEAELAECLDGITETEPHVQKAIGHIERYMSCWRRIRDKRLYRSTFKTFAAFCESHSNLSYRRINQLLEEKEVKDTFGKRFPKSKGLIKGASGAAVRQLKSVPPDAQEKVLEQAAAASPNGQPTAAGIRLANGEIVARGTKPPPRKKPVPETAPLPIADPIKPASRNITISPDAPLSPTLVKAISAVRSWFHGNLKDLSESKVDWSVVMNAVINAMEMTERRSKGVAS
jgi:hypothetical protein